MLIDLLIAIMILVAFNLGLVIGAWWTRAVHAHREAGGPRQMPDTLPDKVVHLFPIRTAPVSQWRR